VAGWVTALDCGLLNLARDFLWHCLANLASRSCQSKQALIDSEW
jgi:hypothetical protein